MKAPLHDNCCPQNLYPLVNTHNHKCTYALSLLVLFSTFGTFVNGVRCKGLTRLYDGAELALTVDYRQFCKFLSADGLWRTKLCIGCVFLCLSLYPVPESENQIHVLPRLARLTDTCQWVFVQCVLSAWESVSESVSVQGQASCRSEPHALVAQGPMH